MATIEKELSTIQKVSTLQKGPKPATAAPNGAALAAFLAAGIGAFAVGLFVLLNEMGIFTAPSLYGPAGGVSGRTTFAMVVWLVAWGALHTRWKGREVTAGPVWVATAIFVLLGILGTFPPFWGFVS